MDKQTKKCFFRLMNTYLETSKSNYLFIIKLTRDDNFEGDDDKLKSHKDVYLYESKFLKSIIDKKPIEYITTQFNKYKTLSYIHLEKFNELVQEDLIKEDYYIKFCIESKQSYEYYSDIYDKVILTGFYL